MLELPEACVVAKQLREATRMRNLYAAEGCAGCGNKTTKEAYLGGSV